MPRLWGDPHVPFAVFLASALSAFGALSNTGQVFQSDEGVWVLCDDLFGERVIGLLLEPSLSLGNASDAAFRPTSAFLLQAFA